MSRKQIAFTLIELLVVIAIIGILSGLIVVTMNGVTDKANIAKAQIFSNSLRNSLMLNLVSEWKMDNGFGTTSTESWSGVNTGTLNGFNDTTAGYGDSNVSGWMSSSNCISGTCLKFDGSNDYVSHDNPLLGATAATVCAWVKRNTYVQYAGIIADYSSSSNRNLILGYESPSGTLNFYVGSGATSVDIISFSSFTGNVWHYICGSFVGSGELAIWMDGIKKNSKTTAVVQMGTTQTANSATGRYNSYYFNGLIDEVRLFNMAIPASRIKEQYYTGLNKLLVSGQVSLREYMDNLSRLSEYSAIN